ncbi:DUF6086 family protein [Actinospica robiniae]|uniref:DUF6086 family protein n=1 Tax=Actinospica robiniae TaxID=304901 RepID=UPI000558176C|nr:DUF6086 family protein [Actinospica robiniae]
MSQYFRLADVALWSPSNGASGLFLQQASVFEAQIGMTSGIGPMEEDEAEVDGALLGEFVSTLLDWRSRTNHTVMTALSDGFIATCVVLAERAGASLRWPEPLTAASSLHDVQVGAETGFGDGWQGSVREQAALLARAMCR